MKSRDEYYMALELAPGATQEEIRSAYRRMAKLYHPDQDASLDAEVRYRDARLAYDALRKRAGQSEQTGQAGQTARQNKNSQQNNAQESGAQESNAQQGYAQGGYAYYEGGGWYTYEPNEKDESGFRQERKERIPFSFTKLPSIFSAAFAEVVTLGMFVRVLLHAALIGGVTAPVLPGFWLLVSILGPLPCFLLFAYYFPYEPGEPRYYLRAALLHKGSILYTVLMGILVLCFNFRYIREATTAAFLSLLILWVRPQDICYNRQK